MTFKTLLPPASANIEKSLDKLATAILDIDLKVFDLNPKSCPANLLAYLAKGFNITLDGLTETEQRTLLSNAFKIHQYRGTVYAVQKALDALFTDAKIIEFKNPYHFSAEVDVKADVNKVYNIDTFKLALKLVEQAKNARSRFAGFNAKLADAKTDINVNSAANFKYKLNSDLALSGKINNNISVGVRWII